MTLQLAIKITADAGELVQGGNAGAAALDKLDASAKQADASVQKLASDMPGVAASAGSPTIQGGRPGPAPAPASAAASRPTAAAPRPIAAANSNEEAGGINRIQAMMFGRAAQNTLSSFSAGASPMQILMQQGSEVAEAFAMGSGSPLTVLKSLGSSIVGLVTPTTLAIGAVGGLAVAVGLAGLQFSQQQTAITNQLKGVGRGSGATLGQINDIADQTTVPGLSRSDARDLAAGYAGTGRVSGAMIGQATSLTPQLARETNQSIGDAGQMLAGALADPAKGAETLEKALGPLDDKTKQLIQTFMQMGDISKAQKTLLDAIAASTKDAADQTGFWASKVTLLKNAWDTAGEAIAKPFTGGTLQEQLADATAKSDDLQKQVAESKKNTNTESPLAGIIGQLDSGLIAQAQAALAKVADLQAQIDAQNAKAAAEKKTAEDNAASQIAGNNVRSILPDIQRQQTLQGQLASLNNAAGSPDIMGKMGVSAQELQEAIGDVTGAINTYMSANEKARASEDLAVASINARTAAEKAAIASQRERISLAGQSISADEQQRRADAAADAVYAQTNRDSQDRLKGANDNAALAGLPEYQRQLTSINQKYRDIINNDAGSSQAQTNDKSAQAVEIYAAQQTAIAGPMRDANKSLQEQTAALQVQQEAFGKSAGEAARLAAAQQLVNQYNAAGVPITDQLRAGIDAYAASAGKVAQASSDLTEKQQAVISSLDQVRDTSRTALGGLFTDLAHGTSAADALANAAGKISDTLLNNAASQITTGLFDKDGKPGGGLLGGALQSLFSKQQGLTATGTANISAGVVNVNGGLGINAGAIPGIPGGGTATATAAAANTNSLARASADAMPGLGPAAKVLSSPLAPVTMANAGTTAITAATDPTKAAFLDAVAATESGGKYNIRYGGVNSPGKTFTDFSQHPNVLEPTADGRMSSAAGAYEITGSTYNQYGGGAFDANAQRNMAWNIAQDRSGMGSNLEPYLQQHGLDQNLLTKLGPTWKGLQDNPNKALSSYQSSIAKYNTTPAAPAAPVATPVAPPITAAAGSVAQAPNLNALQTSLTQVNSSAQTAAQGITSVGSNLGSLQAPLNSVATTATQAGSSLGTAGGGLTGALTSLMSSIGSGISSAFSSIGSLFHFADGGQISGAGTGRSDSILAKVSHGEFIVNAGSTAKHLPLLHAINNNALPAFASGGLNGPVTARPGFTPANSTMSSGGGSGTTVNLYNQAGAQIDTKSSTDSKGNKQLDVYLGKSVADQFNKPGSPGGRAVETTYGLQRQVTRR